MRDALTPIHTRIANATESALFPKTNTSSSESDDLFGGKRLQDKFARCVREAEGCLPGGKGGGLHSIDCLEAEFRKNIGQSSSRAHLRRCHQSPSWQEKT